MRYRVLPSDPMAARELGAAVGLSAAAGQVLLNRGLDDPERAREFLSPELSGLSDPEGMADRGVAAERLARAVRGGEQIVVFGDYDVDGTTSAAILSGILEQLGGRVSTLIANRFEGGYGFSQHALGRVLELSPSLVVTCDCGSSDHPRLAELQSRGIDAIVVDHHLVPDEPLPALAFLNPRRPDCGFGYKWLCSAGLALSVGAAVRKEVGVQLDLRPWLDLVALGTIADVVPLDGDNRRLVRAGLKRLAAPGARPGICALRELAKIRPGVALGATDVAFRMTPRLNAAGRLGDPTLTLSLLRARTLPEARALAARIEQINQERKDIEARVTQEAMAQVVDVYGEQPTSAVVAAGEGWHRGVVGISAARLCDRFGVPAIVVAMEGGEGHGSARAPDGVPMYDAISACADHLTRFGGHQAASGVTLAADRVDGFREALTEALRQLGPLEPAPLVPEVDVVLDGSGFELPPASDLSALEPVGEGNREAWFLIKGAEVASQKEVGDGHLKLTLKVGRDRLSAFGLGKAAEAPEKGSRVSLLGPLRPDTWTGGDAVELRIEELEAD